MPSSPFPDDKPVRVRVTTGRDLAEVFLVDHEFALVARGVGNLDATVAPGVYKIKAQLGDALVERLVVINGDTEVDLELELPVFTPAPLEESARTRDHHMALASEESQTVDAFLGSGAQIFLLARRWTPDPARVDPEGQRLCNLSLHSLEGEKIADLLAEKSPVESDGDAAAGFTVGVDPALYLLRWSDCLGVSAEQTVTALEGWQTQIFLLEEKVDDLPGPRELSVIMSQHPFSYFDPALRLAEEARAALAEERRVATSFISESLFGDVDNPMLGLFGAHLMLIADEALQQRSEKPEGENATAPQAPVGFDQSLFDEVVAKLATLLGGDHPDVVALATKSTKGGDDAPLRSTPMLWRSWRLLIEASNAQPDLVPADLWRRTLGVLPMRPFFTWRQPQDEPAAAARWEEQLSQSLQASSLPESGRLQLTEQLLAPRGVIDEAADQRRTEPLS
jgi:hypothetical protein